MFQKTPALISFLFLAGTSQLHAQQPIGQPAIQRALELGLARVRAASVNYPEHRDCFSCHHQTLPVLALDTAREAGLEVDAETLDQAVHFSEEAFQKQLVNLRRGAGIGGGAMTVAYGLWTFWEPDRPPSELTDAMVDFLLKTQEPDGRWKANPRRPPLESSELTSTVLASLGLDRYGQGERRKPAREAIQRALAWLDVAPATSQEDRAARLWGLWALDSDECKWDAARAEIWKAQRDDGGWAQETGMDSDAYATGQTLAILRLTGSSPDDPRFARGIRFLVESQLDDGSWKVATRSRPVQTFFDNGDPHAESQFISTAATCWAVTALAGAIEPK